MNDIENISSDDDICGCVSANRMNLNRFLKDFITSVNLFELLERGGQPPTVGVFGGIFINFRIVAAKEGALSIFHFGNSLDALRSQVRLCSLTRDTVDPTKLRTAFGQFNKYFPNANNTRHAIAHAGEIWKSAESARAHRQKENYTDQGVSSGVGGFLIAGLFERTYSVGWKGKVFEVHMDAATVQKLTEVFNLAELAFNEA